MAISSRSAEIDRSGRTDREQAAEAMEKLLAMSSTERFKASPPPLA
jgi:hypothetical protein